TQLLEGNFLELQFSQGIFNDKELGLLSSIEAIKKSKAIISKALNEFSMKGIEYFIYYEEGYPTSLKNIPSPPFFLFMKGNKSLLENKHICSIVGTRNPSDKTLSQIDTTVKEMVLEDVVIASGLALGTDIQAH